MYQEWVIHEFVPVLIGELFASIGYQYSIYFIDILWFDYIIVISHYQYQLLKPMSYTIYSCS